MYGEGTAFGTNEYPLDYQKQFTEKPSWKKDNWDKTFDVCIIVLGIICILIALPFILLWAGLGGE